MKKEKTNKYEKGVIIVGIVVAIILLILLVADVIKNKDKKNTVLALSEQEEIIADITDTPNEPKMSAGMIPVKYEEDNLKICKNDNTWYNYAQGTPAYMMLNDGVYQSELVVDMRDKKLASENIGQVLTEEEQGSIYVWIPRFAYKENGEIGYIKEETQPGGEWIVPDTFSYVVEDETKPNFSLSGIWVETKLLAKANAVNQKTSNMTGENNIYGLIANTVGIAPAEEDREAIERFSKNYVGAHICARIDNPIHPYRTIIKIINTNKVEPIKANVIHNTIDKKIEIRVTYNKNGIKEVLDEYGSPLNHKTENGIVIADTGEEVLVNGKYSFTIIDNNNNKEELSLSIDAGNIYTATYTSIDNLEAYTRTKETVGDYEHELLDKIQKTDTSMTYVRVIQELTNGEITAIGEIERSSKDLQLYAYNFYKVSKKYELAYQRTIVSNQKSSYGNRYGYTKVDVNETGTITLSNVRNNTWGGAFYSFSGVGSSAFTKSEPSSTTSASGGAVYEYYTWWSGSSMYFDMKEYRVIENSVIGNSGILNKIIIR